MKLSKVLISLLSVTLEGSAVAGSPGKAPAPVQPEAPAGLFDNLGATATIGYDTNYIFRGVQFAKNLVSAGLDLNLPIDKTFSLDLNAWYGVSADSSAAPFAGGDSYGELDLSPTILAKLGPVTAGLKYTWYHYMNNAGHFVDDVNELGLTLATSVAGFDLGAGVYHDFTAKGWYYEASVSRTIAINSWLSIQPGILISFGSHYYGVEGGNTIKPWLAIPIKLTKTATLNPYIAGNLPYGSLHDLGEKRRVYGGVALNVTF